mmetsp:Transcript_6307/g.8779  ORF Transcript_6307/g.8779 Transcript_6307/m.8779 type:complete len:561 (+) Transcript_6307:29-1711(+)
MLALALLLPWWVRASWDAQQHQSHLKPVESGTSILEGWHKFNLPNAGDFKFQVASPHATFGAKRSGEDVLVLVAARDLYIGCHDFGDYLSPTFETIFVYDKEFADIWDLESLVTKATNDQTLGAYLFVGNQAVGENSARKLGLKYIQTVASIKPLFMFSVNCDLHPIPKDHAMHQSFEYIANNMANTMAKEKRLREDKTSSSQGSFSVSRGTKLLPDIKPIFAMNTIIWETFRSKEHLRDALWHGLDSHNWHKGVLLTQSPKPKILVERNQSWLNELDDFVEAHAMIFDVQKLSEAEGDYFMGDSLPAEAHGIGLIADKYGWCLRRHNEMYMHFDLVPQKEGLNEEKFDPIRAKMDHMFLLNMELASRRRNPMIGWRIYRAYREKGFKVSGYWGPGFLAYMGRRHMVPPSLNHTKVTDEFAQRWIKSAMEMLGYVQIDEETYTAPGAFPSTSQLSVVKDRKHWHIFRNVFFTFNDKKYETQIYSMHPDRYPVTPDYPVERRTIRLPINDDSYFTATSWPFGQEGTAGWPLFHVLQSQCEASVLFRDDPFFTQQWEKPMII